MRRICLNFEEELQYRDTPHAADRSSPQISAGGPFSAIALPKFKTQSGVAKVHEMNSTSCSIMTMVRPLSRSAANNLRKRIDLSRCLGPATVFMSQHNVWPGSGTARATSTSLRRTPCGTYSRPRRHSQIGQGSRATCDFSVSLRFLLVCGVGRRCPTHRLLTPRQLPSAPPHTMIFSTIGQM